ncbi:hypothetical protein scyTo_0015256 [Scyliorhinus torazame]|uniref:Uncharacterized protein n=1 Tax=Scyliorhinus torazame TaxID=75743 RepID=A0A401P6R8_SCYTO|nr:hypothetical protein [Scyliorhinus torazame]
MGTGIGDRDSLLEGEGTNDQEQQRQLRKLISLRDWLMAVLAFPVGVMVVIMFWALYLYDRELVYPKILDSFIPPWINHGMVFYSKRNDPDVFPGFLSTGWLSGLQLEIANQLQSDLISQEVHITENS